MQICIKCGYSQRYLRRHVDIFSETDKLVYAPRRTGHER